MRRLDSPPTVDVAILVFRPTSILATPVVENLGAAGAIGLVSAAALGASRAATRAEGTTPTTASAPAEAA